VSTHYDVLNVERNATPDQIKKAYRKTQLKNHPDKTRHLSAPLQALGERVSKAANNAYEVLSDPAACQDYELKLRARPTSSHINESEQALQQSQHFNHLYGIASTSFLLLSSRRSPRLGSHDGTLIGKRLYLKSRGHLQRNRQENLMCTHKTSTLLGAMVNLRDRMWVHGNGSRNGLPLGRRWAAGCEARLG
jgi:DnaJ-class molecular chaperone